MRMKFNSWLKRFLIGCAIWGLKVSAHADLPGIPGRIDALQITERTLGCTTCLNYSIKGVCFFLRCTVLPPSCSVRESFLLEHYLPDYVVAVYSNNSPIAGMGVVTDSPNGAIRTQHYSQQDPEDLHVKTNLDFKWADILVNPAILVTDQLAGATGLMCRSVEEIPMLPKFVSHIDPAWTSPLIEQFYPQAISGFPRMGRLPEYWGPIYPRTGWNSLPFNAQSALVVAHRASDILTGGFSSHVFIPPGTECQGQRCWLPPQVELDDPANRYQMIFPETASRADPLPREGSWVRGRETMDQRYAWVLWREYQCCERRGSYIERVTW